jgi:polysaccharide export outer membrane protein
MLILCVAWVVGWSARLATADENVASPPAPGAPAVAESATAPSAASELAQQPSAAPAASGEYRIQPGDSVTINVLGVAECSGTYTVRPDGNILLQDEMIGPIAVAGKTSREAAEIVTSRVSQYVKDPKVMLTITQFKIMVVGEVKAPGQYDLTSGARLMDALQRAGGVKDDDMDLPRVYVTNASGQQTRYNLRNFRERADASQNPILEPGDRVAVGRPVPTSSKADEFKVTGAVAKPGTFSLIPDEPTRVSDAIRQAGRWTDDGNPRAAKLTRKDGTSLLADLTQIDLDLESPENVELRDGDELFVPRNSLSVSVLGGVKTPGEYHVSPGTTVLEVISKAGGTTDSAILERCVVVRCQPQPTRIGANLKQLTENGDVTQNPVLQDRDVVFVPAKASGGSSRSPFTLGSVASFAGSLTSILWLFRYMKY